MGSMTGEWLDPFFDACRMATDVMAEHAVAARWTRPSALPGLTTGGLAGHLYAAIRRFEVALDEDVVGPQTVLALPEFYGLNRVEEPAELDAGWHPLLREDAERRASYGPQAVVGRFTELVDRLGERLARERPDRLIPVWTVPGGVTALEAYVATRVVELVVHVDDLAVSADLPPLSVPHAAASCVVDVFVDMARHRGGDLAVIRAFARRERASDGTLRVL